MVAPLQCGRPHHRDATSPCRTVITVSAPRPPRFLPFAITGAVVGFVLGAVLAASNVLTDPDPLVPSDYSWSAGVGYLGFLCAALFAIVGVLVALFLDRRANRS